MKQLMIEELNILSSNINNWQEQLKKLPTGTFYATRNGKYYKWLRYADGQIEVIKKSNIDLARASAFATFLRHCISDAEAETDAIRAYLRNVNESESERYIKNPEIRRLLALSPVMSDMAAEWAAADYPKSALQYKGTCYKTLKGDLVKSRAEKDIADELFLAGIPYRYECVITLGNKTYCRDFMIMDPSTGKIYIWEHFGMEDLNYYLHKNADKLYTYFENGYIPGNNLICTSSSEGRPLTKAQIRKTIDFYFK